jgi:hypothetical protein
MCASRNGEKMSRNSAQLHNENLSRVVDADGSVRPRSSDKAFGEGEIGRMDESKTRIPGYGVGRRYVKAQWERNPKYLRRKARYLSRMKAWNDLLATIDALIQRSKTCRCRRNKYRCRACSDLMDKVTTLIAERKYISTDPSFDTQCEPRE